MENKATQILIENHADIMDDTGECTYLGWFTPNTGENDENNCAIARIKELDGITRLQFAEGYDVARKLKSWKYRHCYNYLYRKIDH